MKAELTRCQNFRYKNMMDTIAEWENEKKVKAKRQKEQKEVFVYYS